MTPALILAAIIIAAFAYPAARALDRWVQRIENEVAIRRRREMHEQAVAGRLVQGAAAGGIQNSHDASLPIGRAPV